MSNAAVNIICTVGAGMQCLASKEIQMLTETPVMDVGRGKLKFCVDTNSLSFLKTLTLVERVFLCLLFDSVEGCSDEFHLFSIVDNLFSKLESDMFKHYLNLWWLTQSDSSYMLQSNIVCKLFVKLRPRVLIRHTENVRQRVVDHLFRICDVTFNESSRIEMNLVLADNCVFLGIPLTKSSMSKRTYAVHIGLRSTTARTISLEIGDGIVLDPMCGKGIVLCESVAHCHQQMKVPRSSLSRSDRSYFVIGCDCSIAQLLDARQNLMSLCTEKEGCSMSWDLVQCFADKLPIRDGIIDQLVCDLPFGKRYGAFIGSRLTFAKDELKILYVKWIEECKRLLRSGGGRFGLLVGCDLTNVVLATLSSTCTFQRSEFKVERVQELSLGLTKATLISGVHQDVPITS